MLLSGRRQWIRELFNRFLGGDALWHLSSKAFLALPLALCCVSLLCAAAGSYGLMILQTQRFQVEWQAQHGHFQEAAGQLMPALGQGSWLGITVMPALASPLPVPGLGERFADMRILSRQIKRHQVTSLKIEPVAGEGLRRKYQLEFHADANNWVSILSDLSMLPGVQLQQQKWAGDGQATLQAHLIGHIPAAVVGQVGGGDGETRLLLRDGRLQRSAKPGGSFQNHAH
ncbi:hypothetical protein GCM10011403_18490 [Pseudohongiella nitratireducens]|uniref:Transmembrane protein n=1 Tax=Pseudohongiella nitratireducens TaxID=1768907 RepID=A0A916VJJ3_9GAMM|nr:hypothetical protein [Pseudohongiella nitratireducens]MDF1622283.1 hypothetical protein [Pseudohongiella nitratireducens]GFZ75996.1 hypothetical protein GCM10011403_18490 [Pseudohongiella nitratireducens]